jgi:hypothetical protein
MKANALAVLVICAMAGAAVSCRTAAPHAVLNATDYPQARKGATAQWSSNDGNAYDIQFTVQPPCRPGDNLHVGPATRATCHVAGRDDVTSYYSYTIVPSTGATPGLAHRVFIVPCHGCSHTEIRSKRPPGQTREAIAGAEILLGWSNGVGTAVAIPQCSSPSSTSNDACVNPGQLVEWLEDGGGNQWTATFPQPSSSSGAPTTPCVDISNNNNPIYTFSSDNSQAAPSSCTIAQNAAPSGPTSYPYSFTVNGVPADKGSATLTVKAPTR